MAKQTEPPKFRYVDRPEVNETFVDSYNMFTFENGNFRLELTVKRSDPPQGGGQLPGGQQLTACRLVIPYPAFADMVNRFNQMLSGMEAAAKQKAAGGSQPGGSGPH